MSITWLNAAWTCGSPSPTQKLVLLVLADHADEDGFCWPRVRTICERTGLSDRAVRNAVAELEDDGIIAVTEEYEPAGRQTSNIYQLVIPPVSPAGGRVQQVQGAPARRAPSTRTTNEPSDGSTSTRGAARRRGPGRPKGAFQLKEADDTTSTNDGPVLGASPRPSRQERDQTAATRGTSGVGLAMRLQRQLEANGAKGEMLNVNIAALGKQLTSAKRRGTSWEVLAVAVDLYARNPKRYTAGDAVKGWTGFLAALPKLVDDAGKHQRADAGGAAYSDPYAGVED